MGKSYRMPRCSQADIEPLLDAVERLRGDNYDDAMDFVEKVSPKGLCEILHGMRRWYSNQTWAVAQKVIAYHDALQTVMDLEPPIGAYRGFKVDKGHPMYHAVVGGMWKIPVDRNGSCSSWTLTRADANKFSGKGKGKVGIVVKLVGGDDMVVFIAPPSRTEQWFNRVYEWTMGRSFRFTENEYALCCDSVVAEVVDIKR